MYSLPQSELQYRRVDRSDETWIHLSGSLDELTVRDLDRSIEELLGTPWRLVIVDASCLVLIDSTGVGLLISLLKRVRSRGGVVILRGLADQPLAVFRLLNLLAEFVPSADRVLGNDAGPARSGIPNPQWRGAR
jgi:anti-sigma B factor antagonist